MNTTPVSCFDAPPFPLPCGAKKRALAQAIGQLTNGQRVDAPLGHSLTGQVATSLRDMSGKQIAEFLHDEATARAEVPDLWFRAALEQVRRWEEAFLALDTEAKPYLTYAAEMAERKQLAVVELERAIADAATNGVPTERLADDMQLAKRERNTWRWLLRKRGLHGDQTAPLHEQFEHFMLMHIYENRNA